MNIVVDTNVIVSGIFFSGTPGKILSAWRSGRVTLVVSPLILHEYWRVASELSVRFQSVDIVPILNLITIHSEIVEDQTLASPVCRDGDDDKFLACASASKSLLVSGDKDLLAVDGALGVHVLTPRALITLMDQ